MPVDAKLILPGLALAYAINAGTVFAGNDGLTSMMWGVERDARDRRNVADEIEIELVVERRVDGICRNDLEQSVAVGGCPDDRLSSDIGGAPVRSSTMIAGEPRQSRRAMDMIFQG